MCLCAILASCASYTYNSTEDSLVGKLSGEILGQLVSWQMNPDTSVYNSTNTAFFTGAYKDIEQLKVSLGTYGEGAVMNSQMTEIDSIESILQQVAAKQKEYNKLSPAYCEITYGQLKAYFEELSDFETTLKNGSSPATASKTSTTSAASGTATGAAK